jgi:hypothetical protein
MDKKLNGIFENDIGLPCLCLSVTWNQKSNCLMITKYSRLVGLTKPMAILSQKLGGLGVQTIKFFCLLP